MQIWGLQTLHFLAHAAVSKNHFKSEVAVIYLELDVFSPTLYWNDFM